MLTLSSGKASVLVLRGAQANALGARAEATLPSVTAVAAIGR